MKRVYTDREIIDALRKGGHERELVWYFMYKNWKDYTVGFIINKGGAMKDALESIGDIARPFETRIIKPDFVLEAQLRSYFVTCVYRRWIKVNKKNVARPEPLPFGEAHVTEFAENVVDQIMKTELATLLDRTLTEIGDRCKKILTLFMNKYSMKDIAVAMGFENEVTSKKEKYKCQKKYEDYLGLHPLLEQKLKDLLYE